MEYLFIYLLQISTLIICAAFLFLVIGIVALWMWFYSNSQIIEAKVDEEKYPYACKDKGKVAEKEYADFIVFTRKMSIICLCLSLFLFLLPSKQTLVMMSGVYYGKMAFKQVITNEKIKKVNEIIDLQLDKIIKELKK